MQPLIDTHQHLWDLSKFNLPWTASSPLFNQSYLIEQYIEATCNAAVEKAVYMEVDVAPGQEVEEAEYILKLCEQDDTPTCGAVISGRPSEENFDAYIKQFTGNKYIKGIRQVLHVPETAAGYCLNPTFIHNIRLLGTLDLSFDICIRPSELSDALKLAKECPDTLLIIDHCGNADPAIVNGSKDPGPRPHDVGFWHTRQQWLDDMNALAERPNVICKISGIVARADPNNITASTLAATVNHCIDSFGEDRVVFGGDWPVCLISTSYQGWVNVLREIIAERSQTVQRKLLYDNAVRIYNLG